jgi:HD-like signal output (HDOD) protein
VLAVTILSRGVQATAKLADKRINHMDGHNTIVGLLPRDPGLLMHCRRVAALGQAVAHHLFLTTEQKSLLYAASLLHHYDIGLFAGGGMQRLMADLVDNPIVRLEGGGILNESVRGVLDSFAKPGAGTDTDCRLAGIVRMADAFDCEYEAAALDGRPVNELLRGLRDGASGGLWSLELIEALEQIASATPVGEPGEWRIPSFASAAARILSLMSSSTVSVRRLEEAAGTDPATAGRLMQLANSAMFCFRTPVSTLGAAITRLGFQSARRVIAASLAKPLLAGPRMQALWRHSLEAADFAEQIAERTGAMDPGEAYLSGLLHDIGALVLSRLPLYDAARLQGLENGGCPSIYAENLILRLNHADLGADLAEYWRLPAPMPLAIRYHHRPEKTPARLAHLLYLAEFLTGGDEDIPSRRRLTIALDSLALRFEDAVTLRTSQVSEWLAAA